MVIYTESEAETSQAGEDFVTTLAPGSVVALHGDLGAGKNCLC